MMRTVLLFLFLWVSCQLAAQPVYTFRVKVGIDRESVDSLGGRDKVVELTKDMFRKVNRAFNHDARFGAVYNFEVDWDAFYIYEGISTLEVSKPHPGHDYLVVMDGYKSHPREKGGGWNGDGIQTIYHARTHNDRFNSPFEQNAIDGIIHEFGHARGVPDIYAMTVNADKNPVNGMAFGGIRCIMNYCYGESHWSDYAVNMINLAGYKNIDIDDLVVAAVPEFITVSVTDQGGKPVSDAVVKFYPVRWYSYSVAPLPEASGTTGPDGICSLPTDSVFKPEKEFGRKHCNFLVEAGYGGLKTYGWLPLYVLQNAYFEGGRSCRLDLVLKKDCMLTREIIVE